MGTKMGQLRILMLSSVDPGRNSGRVGEFVRELSHRLCKSGYELRCLLVSWGDLRGASGWIDYEVDATKELLAQVLPILRDFDPHIIHACDRMAYWPFRGLPRVLLSLGLEDDEGLDEVADGLALGSCEASLVYSRFMQDRARNWMAPGSVPIVLPLGRSVSRSSRGDTGQSSRRRPRAISYFGRFDSKQKGFSEFLQAARALLLDPQTPGDLEFRAYGHGYVPEQFKSIAGLVYPGMVGGSARDRAYYESDIVVVPSTYESFGQVGLEAMAAGCLLLAPSGLGLDEFFEPGRNGLRIEASSESIAEVLKWTITHWDQAQRLSVQAIEDARSWTWEASAFAHAAVYERISQGYGEYLGPSLPVRNARTMVG